MNIREKIFGYILRRQPKRQVHFPRWENVRTIVILFESDLIEKNPTVRRLAERLSTEEADKNVTLLGYVDKKDILSPNLPQSRILGRKDFTIFGVPKANIREELMRHPYDLLIDLTQKDCLPLRYMATYLNADFKTGRHIREGIHDFMLDTPAQESQEFLFGQIIYYLKLIKSND
ncbi:MAG: hypothetical protein MJZ88_02020 [Paludibacteraceae bacterium]|nr:hypothetical protein [Candidatus Colicola coprequi]MCQ2333372.1 hypothetical protein [Paludibacteraceae bacterium]